MVDSRGKKIQVKKEKQRTDGGKDEGKTKVTKQ